MKFAKSHDGSRFIAYLPAPDDPQAYVKWSLSRNASAKLYEQLKVYLDERPPVPPQEMEDVHDG